MDNPKPGYGMVMTAVKGWNSHEIPTFGESRSASGKRETTPESAKSNHPA
jgi:hypothetical protein